MLINVNLFLYVSPTWESIRYINVHLFPYVSPTWESIRCINVHLFPYVSLTWESIRYINVHLSIHLVTYLKYWLTAVGTYFVSSHCCCRLFRYSRVLVELVTGFCIYFTPYQAPQGSELCCINTRYTHQALTGFKGTI